MTDLILSLYHSVVGRQLNKRKSALWLIRSLIACGGVAILVFFSWWFQDDRLGSPVLGLVFFAALLYCGVQMAGNWFLYWKASRPPEPPPSPGLTVDVFVTACREPYALVERALSAAITMRGNHHTWLLDDGDQPELATLAASLGAGYLTRLDRKDTKAGNLNAGLARTSGEVIVIFDIDHAPKPDFLERTLGYFADPEIGFVQVMLTFANSQESWVAGAAMETSLEFYNPTSLGTHMIGSATLMGSNALIRRKALESIGGYQPGLAEDLATSITLHAAGWCSAYVAEPLAPGIAPPDLSAWFTQQFKWARGVFELLVTAYPRLFHKLSPGQRISYAVRMTKYWIGPAVAVHLFATIAILIFGSKASWDSFHLYLILLTPLVVFDGLIRTLALRLWRHPSTPRTSLLGAVVLVYATWPIYLLAWFMALFRMPLAFRPTPKSATGSLNLLWLLPQSLTILLLAAGLAYTVLVTKHPVSLLLLFAIFQGMIQLAFLSNWLYSGVRNKDKKGVLEELYPDIAD